MVWRFGCYNCHCLLFKKHLYMNHLLAKEVDQNDGGVDGSVLEALHNKCATLRLLGRDMAATNCFRGYYSLTEGK